VSAQDILEETPKLLAATDEAEATSEQEDLSPEQMRRNVLRWAFEAGRST
jgi:hypothetical protein